MSFSDLGLLPELLRAVADKGYDSPSPIQATGHSRRARRPRRARRRANRHRQNRRLRAADFAAPGRRYGAGHRRARRARSCSPRPASSPRRSQRARAITASTCRCASTQVFGGVNINPQISALRSGCDILVATPGRLLDLAQQRAVDLSKVQVLVLDEADRMLDMGFIHDIKRDHQTAARRSARTCCSPRPIRTISAGSRNGCCTDPLSIQVAPRNAPIELVEQRAYRVHKDQKRHLLVHLIQEGQWHQVLDLHAHQARRQPARAAARRRRNPAAAIHGNKSQAARVKALDMFKRGQVTALGGHRSRRARTRHQGTAARGQLRIAQRPGRLCAPHRPHRPGGRASARRCRWSREMRADCCATSSVCCDAACPSSRRRPSRSWRVRRGRHQPASIRQRARANIPAAGARVGDRSAATRARTRIPARGIRTGASEATRTEQPLMGKTPGRAGRARSHSVRASSFRYAPNSPPRLECLSANSTVACSTRACCRNRSACLRTRTHRPVRAASDARCHR